jgi:hypothetical protein
MTQTALKTEETIAVEEYGEVISLDKTGFVVRTGSGSYTARRAVSCLIEPRLNDKVLLCLGGREDVYILAILERPDEAPCELKTPGDLNITIPNGALRLAAAGGIEAFSAQSVEMTAPRMRLSGEEAEMRFGRLYYWGKLIQAVAERVASSAQVVESAVERLTQTVQTSYRTIKEAEHIRAESLYYSIRRLFSLRGKYTVITAKEDVKIDGRHIHMG